MKIALGKCWICFKYYLPVTAQKWQMNITAEKGVTLRKENGMKVLNFGSLNVDYVYTVDHMVMAGETLSGGEMNIFSGGKGLNQSIALAKAGVSVYHAGIIGDDGGILLDTLKANGVNTEFVRRLPGRGGHTIIQVDKSGQNCILVYGGTNRKFTKEFVDEVLESFEEGDILLLQNEVNLLAYMIDRAHQKGMTVALNPSPCDDALKECELSKVSMFLINEIEGGQMTGESEPDKILKKLRQKYPDAKIVLTLGGNGSVYQDRDMLCRQEIFPVKAVDTTAAGDTFTGYFISSMIDGLPVQEGLRMAAKASAIAVSRKGAADSIPLRTEL